MPWGVGGTGEGVPGGRSRLLTTQPSHCPRTFVMILEPKQVMVSVFRYFEGVTQAWPAESMRKAIEVGEQPSKRS